jgi:hypothetical protein
MCNISEFRCTNGQCIPADNQCNAVYDCFDNSDEINCGLYITSWYSIIENLVFLNNGLYLCTSELWSIILIWFLKYVKSCIKWIFTGLKKIGQTKSKQVKENWEKQIYWRLCHFRENLWHFLVKCILKWNSSYITAHVIGNVKWPHGYLIALFWVFSSWFQAGVGITRV